MDAPTLDELKNRFLHHAPDVEQTSRYEGLRHQALGFAQHICDVTPASREQSLALTKLEEVVFFANAAIARREGPQ
jgi:hypothetical protein